MKTLVLVLAMVAVLGGMVVADTATYDVYNDWNCISAPLVPYDPDPVSVFSGVTINGKLSRFDATVQSGVSYLRADPASFGNVLLGDGYWLQTNVGEGNSLTISFQGIADGVPDSSGNLTDMWISLPGDQYDEADNGGWHLIGQPFNHDTATSINAAQGDHIFLTDGTYLKTWKQAVTDNWCGNAFIAFDASAQSGYNVGYLRTASDDTLHAGYGYWFQTKKDNLALIIPSD